MINIRITFLIMILVMIMMIPMIIINGIILIIMIILIIFVIVLIMIITMRAHLSFPHFSRSHFLVLDKTVLAVNLRPNLHHISAYQHIGISAYHHYQCGIFSLKI